MSTTQHRLELDLSGESSPVRAALIWAVGIAPPSPTETAPPFLFELLNCVGRVGEEYVPLGTRQRVRKMLRYGKYKPSGRSKPASEFLLRAALHDAFPLVNGPVDVNNAISLRSGLPASIFDAERSGRRLLLRRGRAGEAYVFNPSGQSIDLEDLLVVCRQVDGEWVPCGNPVRDSMATKIHASTREVVAVLYAPADEPRDSVRGWATRYAELLADHCRAGETGIEIVP